MNAELDDVLVARLKRLQRSRSKSKGNRCTAKMSRIQSIYRKIDQLNTELDNLMKTSDRKKHR